jgi:mRNA interferase MazF
VSKQYFPERGDLVWLDLQPTLGHEQSGRRPVLILSKSAFSRKTGMAICCPVTSVKKGYIFEVEIPDGAPTHGVVLSDQVRCVSYRNRNCKRIGAAPETVLVAVTEIVSALIGG